MDGQQSDHRVTQYIEKPRHWCPHSEKYTGVDRLLSAVLEGWTIQKNVFRHEALRRMSRRTIVYYFELKRDEHVVTMAVIANPRITEVIQAYGLRVMTNTYLEASAQETVETPVVATNQETVQAPAVATETATAEAMKVTVSPKSQSEKAPPSKQVAFAS